MNNRLTNQLPENNKQAMCIITVALLLLSVVSSSYTAKILAIIPTASYSHQIAFRAIWKELSLRGHKVTLITTDPLNDPKLTHLTEIDVSWSYKYMTDITNNVTHSDGLTPWDAVPSFMDLFVTMVNEQMNYPPIKELIRDESERFDVVIVEHFHVEYLGFAEKYKCPKIIVGSLDTWASFHGYMGNANHPDVYPELASPYYGKLNFKDRLMNIWYSWHIRNYLAKKGFPGKEKNLHKHFNITVPLLSLLSDIDLLMLDVNPVIQGVRAVGPTTIYIGGYRSAVSPVVPLEKDLQEFLDTATEGFIYFSLGSNVKSRELGEETLNSIISTLSELPYKVIWKFEADTLPGKPNNVKLVKWSPQEQVLAHHNIKLFITQCGMQSMEEGIYHEVPFVAIPYFGDQFANAAVMKSKGIAKIVNKDPFIKKEELKSAILEVIRNPKYKIAVQKLKRLSLDFPMTGLEQAIWWIEHVIRNNGTKHLRNPIVDLPTYQYYLLDVIGFVIMILVVSILILILSVRTLVSLVRQHFNTRFGKVKEN